MKNKTSFMAALAAVILPATAIAQATQDIVTRGTVGAETMPAGIMPTTEAPFKTKALKRPVFKKQSITISKADIDARGMITRRINTIISQLSRKGGGTVVVPSGRWLTGRITLMSGINLHLSEGAILEFSADINDYQPAVFTRHEGVEVMGAGAFIYANKAKNIALTGRGTIMGPAMDVEMRRLKNGNSVVDKDINHLTPIKDRLCDGKDGRTFYRPKSFSPINCKNVLVEGVTFERSVLWNINPVYCDNVIIRGVTVNSVGVPSGDGIDISSCKNVLIEHSTLNCGDDCFTLKSGRCEDGMRVGRPTENVLIRYCLAKEGHGGITLGSETAGGINNVYLHHCVFLGTRTGFRFKTRRNRGGTVEGITYDNVRLTDVREAVTFDLLGSAMYMGKLAQRNPPLSITPLTPTVRDITIKNFIIESADRMMSVNGIPEIPCSGITLENGTVNTNMIFKSMRDADGITLKNITLRATNNAITIDNARNITFSNVTLHLPDGKLNTTVKGRKGEDVKIE